MTGPCERSRRFELPSVQLTIYVAEPHIGGRRSKVDELLRRAAQAGVSGATVIAAYQGFGRHHSHKPTLFRRADTTPLTVVFVDRPERIDAVLSIVDELIPNAVAVIEHVRAIRYIRPHRH